jgi:hypothetical protein
VFTTAVNGVTSQFIQNAATILSKGGDLTFEAVFHLNPAELEEGLENAFGGVFGSYLASSHHQVDTKPEKPRKRAFAKLPCGAVMALDRPARRPLRC